VYELYCVCTLDITLRALCGLGRGNNRDAGTSRTVCTTNTVHCSGFKANSQKRHSRSLQLNTGRIVLHTYRGSQIFTSSLPVKAPKSKENDPEPDRQLEFRF